MSPRRRLAIVLGGRSVEHAISLRSARTVVRGASPERYERLLVAILPDGRWYASLDLEFLGPDGLDLARGERVHLSPDPTERRLMPAGAPVDPRLYGPIDVAFPIVHGIHGEDGTLQGVLELASIPYVGCGVTASALCMDKRASRGLLRAGGLPVVDTEVLTRESWERDRAGARERIRASLPLPCFVKPSVSGSSVGVSRVGEWSELEGALDDAFRYDAVALVEQGVDAREIECAVLGNAEPKAAVPGEIVPQREFYDYTAKYHDDRSEVLVPAPVTSEQGGEIRRLAVEAFRRLGCRGMARVDFLLCRSTGRLYVSEVNTIPGFTEISLYPVLWRHEGLELEVLVDRLIELGIEEAASRERNRSHYERPVEG